MKKGFRIAILDLGRIRKELNLSLSEMGDRLHAYSLGIDNDTFVNTRVSEWINGHRPVPGYVFRSAAKLVLDQWCDARHTVARKNVPEVDYVYGSLLNQLFGELLRREHELKNGRRAEVRNLLCEVRKFRRMQQRELERLLDVKMGYVFATEPGGFDEEAAGEVL